MTNCVMNTMDDEGQKMFQVYDNACGKIIISLKNKLVNYVRKNGGRKTLVECFQAIKMDIDDYINKKWRKRDGL